MEKFTSLRIEHLVTNFDQAPPPDYDDYFADLDELDRQGSTGLNRILLYEGSRGCWWGEKHHCTFCGLNAQAMDFRAKSPEQVASELEYLSSRYNTSRFRLVDNIIDMKYVDGLFGQLAQQHIDLDVFMETKSNLNKRQIQTLARGWSQMHATWDRKLSAKHNSRKWIRASVLYRTFNV